MLGIAPSATPDTIHKAYSTLAAKYHPRNPETRDQAKYEAVTLAYEVLSDPEARRAFDSLLPKAACEDLPTFSGRTFFESISAEHSRRLTLLCLLYDRRRQNPSNPTLQVRNLEAMVLFPSPAVQLALWFLKQRGLAIADDKSGLQITADGMEYLEGNMLAPEVVYSLLKPSAVASPPEPPLP